MTARRARRRRRRSGGPVLELAALACVAVVALGVLAVVAVLATAARLWPLLVAGAVVAAWWKLAGRRRAARPLSPRPSVPPPPWTGPPSWPTPDLAAVTADRDRLAAELAAVTADRDRLAAEADGLRRRVAEAQESAHLAWDAAASAPPRRHLAVVDGGRDGPRSALLADPRSGTRPLGGAR